MRIHLQHPVVKVSRWWSALRCLFTFAYNVFSGRCLFRLSFLRLASYDFNVLVICVYVIGILCICMRLKRIGIQSCSWCIKNKLSCPIMPLVLLRNGFLDVCYLASLSAWSFSRCLLTLTDTGNYYNEHCSGMTNRAKIQMSAMRLKHWLGVILQQKFWFTNCRIFHDSLNARIAISCLHTQL